MHVTTRKQAEKDTMNEWASRKLNNNICDGDASRTHTRHVWITWIRTDRLSQCTRTRATDDQSETLPAAVTDVDAGQSIHLYIKTTSPQSRPIIFSDHYYKNVDLSRLGNSCCPGFPTGNASPGQKGVPFCPGSGNRDKRCSQRPRIFTIYIGIQLYFCISIKLLSRFFFSQFFFYFNYTFAFQLNLCIGIQCV